MSRKSICLPPPKIKAFFPPPCAVHSDKSFLCCVKSRKVGATQVQNVSLFCFIYVIHEIRLLRLDSAAQTDLARVILEHSFNSEVSFI